MTSNSTGAHARSGRSDESACDTPMTDNLSKPLCPLCEQRDAREVSRASANDIAKLYKRTFGIDVRDELGSSRELVLYRCACCDLGWFSPAPTGSTGFYKQLQSFDWYYQDAKPEFVLASSLIKASDNVLEIGCGFGQFRQLVPARAYVGLETSPDAVAACRAAGYDVRNEYVEAHAEKHRGDYDVVCTFQVLEHVPTPRPFLNAAVDCLKPGGLFIVSVPNADSYLQYSVNAALNMPPHHVTWWSTKSFAALTNMLPLDQIETRQHHLESLHLRGFLHTLFAKALGQRGLVDLSLRGRARGKIASVLAGKLEKHLSPELRPVGHNLTVVFRKRS